VVTVIVFFMIRVFSCCRFWVYFYALWCYGTQNISYKKVSFPGNTNPPFASEIVWVKYLARSIKSAINQKSPATVKTVNQINPSCLTPGR